MRNVLLARALMALGLTAASAAGAAAQAPGKGHVHTGLSAEHTVHHGDRVWFRGEREVGAREVIEGDVVVASGSLRVVGEVHGDAVVGDGNLVLEAGSVVYGDAVVTGGQLINHGATVMGKVQQGGPTRKTGTQAIQLRHGLFGGLGAGWAGLAGTAVLGLVLCALGAALTAYGRPYLDQASVVVRQAPLNAATVGLAANVLALPAFLVGMLGLVATLVGIPFLLVFIPLFWTVVIVLAAAGVVAVAHALGERAAERRRLRGSEPRGALAYLLMGVGVLLAPLFIAHLLGVTPFTGPLAAVVGTISWTLLWLAASVGAGAVMIVAVTAWREYAYRKAMAHGGMDDLGTGARG
ncbi:polymer-forming cytoskeletal protein [Longimicrobium sp.]|uniref:polymer-forming cytoskeletal protein n=1 Tax=Longimicrobium sp. TaxID=2029185 RepID=UPI002E31B5A8|nr:polymer-forming cytoskeletal protein [Longimicrobium sp.]HEX6040841.1 polymer-forming cytoskeletal protein [Longimicrobium sp.]